MRNNTHKGFTLIEIIIVICINIILGTVMTVSISSSIASTRANTVIRHILTMKEHAYIATIKADNRQNSQDIHMEGYNIVNKNGKWFMVCNLNTIADNLRKRRSEIFSRLTERSESEDLMFSSDPEFSRVERNPESLRESECYVAVFVRHS